MLQELTTGNAPSPLPSTRGKSSGLLSIYGDQGNPKPGPGAGQDVARGLAETLGLKPRDNEQNRAQGLAGNTNLRSLTPEAWEKRQAFLSAHADQMGLEASLSGSAGARRLGNPLMKSTDPNQALRMQTLYEVQHGGDRGKGLKMDFKEGDDQVAEKGKGRTQEKGKEAIQQVVGKENGGEAVDKITKDVALQNRFEKAPEVSGDIKRKVQATVQQSVANNTQMQQEVGKAATKEPVKEPAPVPPKTDDKVAATPPPLPGRGKENDVQEPVAAKGKAPDKGLATLNGNTESKVPVLAELVPAPIQAAGKAAGNAVAQTGQAAGKAAGVAVEQTGKAVESAAAAAAQKAVQAAAVAGSIGNVKQAFDGAVKRDGFGGSTIEQGPSTGKKSLLNAVTNVASVGQGVNTRDIADNVRPTETYAGSIARSEERSPISQIPNAAGMGLYKPGIRAIRASMAMNHNDVKASGHSNSPTPTKDDDQPTLFGGAKKAA